MTDADRAYCNEYIHVFAVLYDASVFVLFEQMLLMLCVASTTGGVCRGLTGSS